MADLEGFPRPRGDSDDEQPADSDLLRAHIAGDPQAFAALVHRHQSRLWLTAWAILRNADDAKDAVQDGLVRAFRLSHTWRGDGSVAGWLHRIVWRVAVDHSVAGARRHRRVLALDDVSVEAAASRDNASDAAAERVVQEVVASLPPDQRECFVRIDLLGFTFAEVATELGLAEGTVKSRRARGKARLLAALREANLVGSNRSAGRSVPVQGSRTDETAEAAEAAVADQ